MAITRVNTTTVDVTGQPFASFGIPTVAAGNTILVCTSDGFFNTGNAPSVSDNMGNTYNLEVSAFTGTVGNPNRRNARIWSVFNSAGGTSSLFINWGSAMNGRIHVLEYSGIKLTSPVDKTIHNDSFATPSFLGNTDWSTAYCLLLSINSDNGTNIETLNGAGAPTPPWTLVSANRATYGGSLGEKIPTVASPGVFEHHNLIGNATSQCVATIVIFKADLSISLTEDIDTDDTETNDTVLDAFLEALGLSDFVDPVLNTNERFKTLLDSIINTDSISFLSVFNRTLIDLIIPLDSILFLSNYVRILPMETIRIQDWLSVKKTNSTRWGN